MPQGQVIALGCALLLGAAIAFPAGLLLGRGGAEQEATPRRSSGPFREVYSPALSTDPWFQEQQRLNFEALEQACRSTGELFGEAQQARQILTESEQGR